MPSNAKLARLAEQKKKKSSFAHEPQFLFPRILHCDTQKTLLEDLVADRQKSRKESFCFYHRITKQLMWGNNEEMTDQMKVWKKQHADGDLTIYDANNQEFVISGKTFYTLTITPVSDGEAQQCGFDPLGVGVRHLVDGYMYWFVHKANRDAVVKYVMELIRKMEGFVCFVD